MGLLDRLGILDQYKMSPTEGPGGMMTQASPFTRQAARNIGGLLGMEMRSNPEICDRLTCNQIRFVQKLIARAFERIEEKRPPNNNNN